MSEWSGTIKAEQAFGALGLGDAGGKLCLMLVAL